MAEWGVEGWIRGRKGFNHGFIMRVGYGKHLTRVSQTQARRDFGKRSQVVSFVQGSRTERVKYVRLSKKTPVSSAGVQVAV